MSIPDFSQFPKGFGPYVFRNSGTSWSACSSTYTAQTDEVIFSDFPSTSEFETAFPNYDTVITEQTKANALSQTIFSKLQIRRAMRELGTEEQLNTLIASSTTFAADWNDAIQIDLSDTIIVQALSSASIDIDAIKLKIAGIS